LPAQQVVALRVLALAVLATAARSAWRPRAVMEWAAVQRAAVVSATAEWAAMQQPLEMPTCRFPGSSIRLHLA
jgi:hypothetical protein